MVGMYCYGYIFFSKQIRSSLINLRQYSSTMVLMPMSLYSERQSFSDVIEILYSDLAIFSRIHSILK